MATRARTLLIAARFHGAHCPESQSLKPAQQQALAHAHKKVSRIEPFVQD